MICDFSFKFDLIFNSQEREHFRFGRLRDNSKWLETTEEDSVIYVTVSRFTRLSFNFVSFDFVNSACDLIEIKLQRNQ